MSELLLIYLPFIRYMLSLTSRSRK